MTTYNTEQFIDLFDLLPRIPIEKVGLMRYLPGRPSPVETIWCPILKEADEVILRWARAGQKDLIRCYIHWADGLQLEYRYQIFPSDQRFGGLSHRLHWHVLHLTGAIPRKMRLEQYAEALNLAEYYDPGLIETAARLYDHYEF